MNGFTTWLLGQREEVVIPLLVLLAAVENVFPPVPADVATALGALWAQRAGHSPWIMGALCFLGNQISAIAVYFWARSRGESVLKNRVFMALVPDAVRPRVAASVERYGGSGVFLSRFLPGVRAAVLPLAAIYGLSPLRALVPAAIASAVWYFLLTAAGVSLGLAYDQVAATVNRATFGLGAVAFALTLATCFWLYRTRAR